MKIIINKLVSSIAVFLVLFFAFSVTINSHYWSDFLIMFSHINEPKVCKSDNKVDFCVKIRNCCIDEVLSTKDQLIEHKHEWHAYVSNKKAITKEKCSVTDFIFHSILLGDEFSQENTYQKKSSKNISRDKQVRYQSFLF
jgi:hypothetical protein